MTLDFGTLISDGICWANDCDCPRWHPLIKGDAWGIVACADRDERRELAWWVGAHFTRLRLGAMSPDELASWLRECKQEEAA